MKLLVFNIPNTLNYGSMMMAENLFYYLTKKLGRPTEFLVVTPKPKETLDRLGQALEPLGGLVGLKAVDPQQVLRGGRLGRAVADLTGVGFAGRSYEAIRGADGLVVLGGDDFTEDYGYLGAIRALVRLRRFAKSGQKVVLCGQSIGPFYSWRRPAARWLLGSMTAIMAREPITYAYLREEFRLENVWLGADLAFLPLARQEATNGGGAREPCRLTVVPSELVWRYAREKDRGEYVRFLTRVTLDLAEIFADAPVLILPHVLAPDNSDDRLAGRDLLLSLRRAGFPKSRVQFVDTPLLPYEARKLLAESSLVFTGRMHAAISAFSCGIPAVSLAYSRKYWGIIGEYLDMKEQVLDVREATWADLEAAVVETARTVKQEYGRLREKIASKVAEMQARATRMIDQLIEILGA